jgi:hypothetical protein
LHAGEALTDARDAAIIAEAVRSMPPLGFLRLADEYLAALTMMAASTMILPRKSPKPETAFVASSPKSIRRSNALSDRASIN